MPEIKDSVTHVLEELKSYGGYQKHIGDNVHVLCPFHDEKTPSCSINLAFGKDVRVGTFFCYGCGAKGGWNKFAKATKLEPIKGWQEFEGTTEAAYHNHKAKHKTITSLNSNSITRLFDEIGGEAIKWPKSVEWRGYKGSLIRRVNGYCFNDQRKDELQLVLPVYINGRYRGGVRALMEKEEGQTSYITTKGEWVREYGLLGFDFLLEYDLFGCNSLVLTEGPRDWLRLIKNKIPALGNLGALMFTDKKAQLLIGLGIKTLYVLPDNDRAGTQMYKLVKEIMSKYGVKVVHLKLPREKDKKGKVIKMDADNAPPQIIREIKKMVYNKKG